MKRCLSSIGISLLCHLCLLLILIELVPFNRQPRIQFQLVMVKKVPPDPLFEKHISKQKSVDKSIALKNNPIMENVIYHDKMDSTIQVQSEQESIAGSQFQVIRKIQQDQLFNGPEKPEQTHQHHIENLFKSILQEMSNPIKQNTQAIPDYLANKDMTVRASSIPPPEHKEKIYRTDYHYIPSVIQCRVLSALDSLKQTDQLSLYQHLGQNHPVTMELFLQEMNQLYQNGFVQRKKTSPQQLFNLFGVSVETSSKNRKNPVYAFQLQIDKVILRRFLESQIDQIYQKDTLCKSDSLHLSELKEKLNALH